MKSAMPIFDSFEKKIKGTWRLSYFCSFPQTKNENPVKCNQVSSSWLFEK